MTNETIAVADGPPAGEDLHCPVCDYALRGLPEPRCPECGYAFEWAELAEQARRRKLWFYEHAGTFKSHLVTRWKSFWLFPLWRELHAYSDTHPRRMIRYRLTTLGLTLVTAAVAPPVIFAVNHAIVFFKEDVLDVGGPRRYFVQPKADLPTALWNRCSAAASWASAWAHTLANPSRDMLQYGLAVVMLLAVTYGVIAYWWVLRRSLKLSGVKPLHVGRISAYVFDVLPVSAVMLAAFFVSQAESISLGRRGPFFFTQPIPFNIAFAPPQSVQWRISAGNFSWWLILFMTPAVVCLPLAFRFGWAVSRYLRLRHAWGVAGAYYVIAVLAWVVGMTLVM